MKPIARNHQHLQPERLVSAAVAAATVALALADGGSAPVAYSIGAVATWATVLIGIAAGFFPRGRPPQAAQAAGACLGAIAVLSALSGIWGSDPGAALDEAVVALAYGGLFTLVVVATVAGKARAWLAGLGIGLGLVALVALGARLEPSLFGSGERELIERLPVAEGRLSEPFLYWNALAAAIATGVSLLAWLGSTSRGRVARTLGTAAIPLLVLTLYMTTSRGGAGAAVLGLLVLVVASPDRLRLAATLAIGLAGAAVLIAFASARSELLDHPLADAARSQAGGVELMILAVVLACGLLAFALDRPLERLRGVRVSIGRGTALGLGAAALTALAVLVIAADPAERWDEFKRPPEVRAAGGERDLLGRGDSSGRYQFWGSAIDALESDPLKGVGAGGFEYWWNRNGSIPEPGPNAHSLIFDSAGELGILGLAAVLGFAGVALVAGIGRVRGRNEAADANAAAFAVLAGGLAAAAIDWIWENPAAFGTVVVAAALLTGPASAPQAHGSGARAPAIEAGAADQRRTRRRFAGGVFVLGFAWVAICASALLLLTNLSLSSSREAFARGDLESAAGAADSAADLEPWAAQPRQQLALVREAQRDIPAAQAAIEEAIERSPEDWRLRLVAARLAVQAGDAAGARAAVRKAHALAPRIAFLRQPPDDVLDGLL